MFKPNDQYEILTPTGFQDFSGINFERKIGYVEIWADFFYIKCSLNHPLKHITGNMLYACDVVIGDILEGKNGPLEVTDVYINENSKLQNFYDITSVNNGSEYISNEFVSHNCNFLGSSNTLISTKKLGELMDVPKINDISDLHLDIFEEPVKDHAYVATVDTSEGLGLDYSAVSIFDITQYPYKQVAKYRNNEIDVMVLPTLIFSLLMKYNEAFCLIEIKSTGLQVASILWDDLGYENIIRVGTDKKLGQVFDLTGQNAQLGLKTSVQTKRIGCTNLKTLIESEKLIVQDENTILELRTFISDGKSWAADEGNNDDLVTTLTLFAWLITQKSFINVIEQDVRKSLSENKYHLPDDTAMLPILIAGIPSNLEPGWIFDNDYQEMAEKQNLSSERKGEEAYWDGKFIEDNPYNRIRNPQEWTLWNQGWIKSSVIF